jgi:hypothetical protein
MRTQRTVYSWQEHGKGSLIQAENPEQVPSYIWQEPRIDSSFEVERLLFMDRGTGRAIILLTV